MPAERTLYTNGHILTMNSAGTEAQALLVGAERIAAVGSHEDLAPLAPDARRVDLEGQTVVPGFNDCHCHILSYGLNLERLDVSADRVRSIEDIKRAVAQRAAEADEDEWVLGRGYDQNSLAERRHPTRHDLDEVARGRPVVLWHTSGHALTCNSRALELAAITVATQTPPGGDIARDAHGEPTGVLMEAPAMDLVAEHVPPPDVEQGTEAVLLAMEAMTRQGITSASDAATGHGSSPDPELQMYRGALESGRLAGRITLMPQIIYVASLDTEEVRGLSTFDVGDQPDWLRIGATKIFSDGALTTRTAALREPFLDASDNWGLLIWEQQTLAGMIRRAHDAGWQIGTHAIGDRAIEVVLDCYEEALANRPAEDHRHRIEHCMLLDEGLGWRMKTLGVVPTIQPGFMSRLGDAYIAALGQDRASQLMPMRLFDALGIRVGFSSDRPVIPGDPLDGVRAAVRRVTPSGVTLGQEHAITALEAIRHYTTGSAFATHSEDRKGVLQTDKLADFAVLSHDPTRMPPEDLDMLHVVMTVVGGREVYQA